MPATTISSCLIALSFLSTAKDTARPPMPEPGAAAVQATVGPDLAVGPILVAVQLGREGTPGSGTVGLALNTTGCNKGNMPIHWFALPNTDHPLLTGNFYRLRTVAGADRFEQIGYGWIKHGFGAAQDNECGFGCTPFPDQSQLGAGCSDPYSAGQLGTACDLAPRSVVNPYQAILPAGSSTGSGGGCSDNYPGNNHNGHVHDNISHRIQVRDIDLIPALNPGARYFGEVQYLVPHEFAAANGNQNNNVSHREFTRIGMTPGGNFGFAAAAAPTQIESPAIDAWPEAYQSTIEPAPMVDGRATLAFKATPLGDGLWHYEYAIYNMNLNRAIGSISIPVPSGVVLSHVGFHAPPHHAAETNAENYPNTPWSFSNSGGTAAWTTETFAANPLANAVRWGTLYNFRFDANTPPTSVSATIGLFKTGDTINIPAVGPSSIAFVDCNGNTIDDRCDLSCAPSGCNVPGCGLSADCTSDGIPDECQTDCNNNTQTDICEIAASSAADCNNNLIPDDCEPGGTVDCNGNLTPDHCDLFTGTSQDFNGNGIPDDCESNRNLWVDDDAPGDPGAGDTGLSDPAEDGTAAHPFDAIQEAIDVSLGGDSVIVSAGTYAGIGNGDMSFGGRAITVRGRWGADESVIDGQGFPLSPAFSFDHGEGRTSLVENLTLLDFNAANFSARGTFYCTGSSPTISRCVNRGGSGFLVAADGAEPLVSGCRVFDSGFTIFGPHGSPTISDSWIIGGFQGIYVIEGQPKVLNSTIDNAGGFAVASSNSTFEIRNSNLRVPNGDAIVLFNNGMATAEYSNVKGGFAGTGNIDADPLYVNAAVEDYHLTLASPSRNIGDPGFVPTPGQRDIDGEARVNDAAVDMGGDEYHDCNSNAMPDYQDIAGATSDDCDHNGVPDECQVTSTDCNGNLTWDACDVASGTSSDCNVNGVPDECDVDTGGASDDCNSNLTPDECERDCNRNGIADGCDIGTISQDCDFNGIPDICETDCNHNGIGDACDIALGATNCNGNGIPDECEPDCNNNDIADECDIVSAFSADCSGNGIPDECEPDCNNNALADSCDILGASDDCDLNGIPDECDMARGAPDCNNNTRYDFCDILLGSSPDANSNGTPDECDVTLAPNQPPAVPPAPHNRRKNRYISFTPNQIPGASRAFRIQRTTAPAGSCWVQAPVTAAGNDQYTATCGANPVFRIWNEPVIHVGDCEIIPVVNYMVFVNAPGPTENPTGLAVSTILVPSINGKLWADSVGSFNGTEWTPPNQIGNVNDVLAILARISGAAGRAEFPVANLGATSSADSCLNNPVNTADVLAAVSGVAGGSYGPPTTGRLTTFAQCAAAPSGACPCCGN